MRMSGTAGWCGGWGVWHSGSDVMRTHTGTGVGLLKDLLLHCFCNRYQTKFPKLKREMRGRRGGMAHGAAAGRGRDMASHGGT